MTSTRVLFAVVLFPFLVLPARAATDAGAEAPQVERADTALHLFATIEDAWRASDADRLASLVDTTSVRIGLKPGGSPTAAVTRSAAAFLFQDQLRLVKTRSFHVVRFEISKKGTAIARAKWGGDWGGRKGIQDVQVLFEATWNGNHWALSEVRAND